MVHPLLQDSAKELRKRVTNSFSAPNVFLTRDSHILFVCGGNGPDKLRSQFCQFAKDSLKGYRVFLAENALADLQNSAGGPFFYNLVRFEELISKVCDCVVLFPESPGSFAELGYFSGKSQIIQKLLVANDISHQSESSFLNHGPIDLVNNKSRFRPCINLVSASGIVSFDPISERLKQRLGDPGKKRHRLDVSKKEQHMALLLAVVLQLVWLCGPIHVDGLLYLLKSIFGAVKKQQVTDVVSLLVAGSYIGRQHGQQDMLFPESSLVPLIESDSTIFSDLRVEIGGYYVSEGFNETSNPADIR